MKEIFTFKCVSGREQPRVQQIVGEYLKKSRCSDAMMLYPAYIKNVVRVDIDELMNTK